MCVSGLGEVSSFKALEVSLPLQACGLRRERGRERQGEGWGAETGECVVSFFLWMSVLGTLVPLILFSVSSSLL